MLIGNTEFDNKEESRPRNFKNQEKILEKNKKNNTCFFFYSKKNKVNKRKFIKNRKLKSLKKF